MLFKNLELFENYLKSHGYEKQEKGLIDGTEMKQANTLTLEAMCYTKGNDEVSVMINVGEEAFQCIHPLAENYAEM